jgi:anaerobic ribonucleoside-triphosphate reductase activating protein
MRYYQKDIVFQEVPGEISLCYFVCGCPLRCVGCHSPFTWNEKTGTELTMDDFVQTLERYRGALSCVLFMGGEWHESELAEYLHVARKMGLKTCLYTGLEDASLLLKRNLTYLKTGPWMESLGGLDSSKTNQRFIQLDTKECLNAAFHKQPLAI